MAALAIRSRWPEGRACACLTRLDAKWLVTLLKIPVPTLFFFGRPAPGYSPALESDSPAPFDFIILILYSYVNIAEAETRIVSLPLAALQK